MDTLNKTRFLAVLLLCVGAMPARAVMDGQGHDFFPVAAIFTASATITYTNAVNAGLTVSSGLVVNNGPVALAASSGNVGIGTTGPTEKLVIQGAMGSPSASGAVSGGNVIIGGGNANIMNMGNITTPAAAWIQVQDSVNSGTNYSLLLNPNGGNVGIGTAGPTAALHVVGVSSVTTSITVNGVEYSYVPRGQVSFFNLSACPVGWTEFTQARGRYLAGLPSGGVLAGAVGTALTDQENRPTGSHVHSVVDAGHSHVIQLYNGTSGSANQIPGQNNGSLGSTNGTNSGTTGITIDAPSGSVAGTNAPYIQLLPCQKN